MEGNLESVSSNCNTLHDYTFKTDHAVFQQAHKKCSQIIMSYLAYANQVTSIFVRTDHETLLCLPQRKLVFLSKTALEMTYSKVEFHNFPGVKKKVGRETVGT
jgi:hypothetical protein